MTLMLRRIRLELSVVSRIDRCSTAQMRRSIRCRMIVARSSTLKALRKYYLFYMQMRVTHSTNETIVRIRSKSACRWRRVWPIPEYVMQMTTVCTTTTTKLTRCTAFRLNGISLTGYSTSTSFLSFMSLWVKGGGWMEGNECAWVNERVKKLKKETMK